MHSTSNGKFVLVANYSSGSVCVLSTDAAGCVEARADHQQHTEFSNVNHARQEAPHCHMVGACFSLSDIH